MRSKKLAVSHFRVCSVALLLVLCYSGNAQKDTPVVRSGLPQFRLGTGQPFVRVPFLLSGNNILVQARLGHSKLLWFIFDTGASISLINQRAAAQLGLTAHGRSIMNGGGGTVAGGVVQGVSLSMPGVAASNQALAVAPLDALAAYSDRDVQGIIGNNFIQGFTVEIDYTHRLITFFDRRFFHPPVGADRLELTDIGGNPFVRVGLSLTGRDKITSLFTLDTGSNGTLSINRPFAEARRILITLPKTAVTEGVGGAGIGGNTKYLDARIRSIRIGRYTFHTPVVSISRDTVGVGAGIQAGFLGTGILRRFDVILDYQSHTMWLQPNASFSAPFETDMSGLEFLKGRHGTVVVKVVRANFPAAAAGLRPGDVIVTVDGRRPSALGLSELVERFTRAGKVYLLTIRRGGKVWQVRLRMRRII